MAYLPTQLLDANNDPVFTMTRDAELTPKLLGEILGGRVNTSDMETGLIKEARVVTYDPEENALYLIAEMTSGSHEYMEFLCSFGWDLHEAIAIRHHLPITEECEAAWQRKPARKSEPVVID